jgi:hypothetical protein
VYSVRALEDRLLPAPALRTWRPFPRRFGSWFASGPFHFHYLTPRILSIIILPLANLLRASVSHFSLQKKKSRSRGSFQPISALMTFPLGGI